MTVARVMSLYDNYIKRLGMTKRNRICKDLVIIVKLLSKIIRNIGVGSVGKMALLCKDI